MWPLSFRRRQISWVALTWRGSVVRMKSSWLKPITPARSRKFWLTLSVKLCGSMPAASAAFSTFWPCSSVPVRNITS